MFDKKMKKLSFRKRIFHSLMEYAVSLIGGVLVFICIYFFFHFETWSERFIYISLSVAIVFLIVKILPESPQD